MTDTGLEQVIIRLDDLDFDKALKNYHEALLLWSFRQRSINDIHRESFNCAVEYIVDQVNRQLPRDDNAIQIPQYLANSGTEYFLALIKLELGDIFNSDDLEAHLPEALRQAILITVQPELRRREYTLEIKEEYITFLKKVINKPPRAPAPPNDLCVTSDYANLVASILLWPREGYHKAVEIDPVKYEYVTTTGPRKQEIPTPDGQGWKEIDWVRGKFSDTALWRRLRTETGA